MSRELPHVKVKLTREMLEEVRACKRGLDAVADLLPATISTDPDENLDLAERLVELYDQGRTWRWNTPTFIMSVWVVTFVADDRKLGNGGGPDCDVFERASNASVGDGDGGIDIGLIAQVLAITADRIDTRRRAARKRRSPK